MLYRTRRTADLRRPESKGGGRYKVHRRRTGRLVTARGETARRHARRRLLDGSHDRLLLLLFLDHGHGHHGHARADGDPGPDESRQGEDGQGDVHRLRARAFCLLPCVRSLRDQARRSIASVVRSLARSRLRSRLAPIFISPSNPRRVRSTRARLVDRFARVLARAIDVDETASPNPRARDRDEDSRRVASRRAIDRATATDPFARIPRCRPTSSFSRARAIAHLNCDETMKR